MQTLTCVRVVVTDNPFRAGLATDGFQLYWLCKTSFYSIPHYTRRICAKNAEGLHEQGRCIHLIVDHVYVPICASIHAIKLMYNHNYAGGADSRNHA